jgi:hypothetical protein
MDAGLVKGGFAAYPLEALRQRGVVSDSLALDVPEPGALRGMLKVAFAAVNVSQFHVSIVFGEDTVIAVAALHVSDLMNLSRSLVVAWRPAPSFPLEFSVNRLMLLLEEISLKSQF